MVEQIKNKMKKEGVECNEQNIKEICTLIAIINDFLYEEDQGFNNLINFSIKQYKLFKKDI